MPGLLHAIAFVIGSAPANSPSTGSHFGRSYADAPRNKTPQARAESCRLPSAPARYTLGQAPEDAAAEELKKLRVRSMAEISMVVTSIDPLAAYKVSDDHILELVNVAASVEDDSEGASVGAWWVQIVEPHKLVKHQPHGGYMLDNRQVQMTCAKSAGISLGDRIKFRIVP
jgi:hypothetical protein